MSTPTPPVSAEAPHVDESLVSYTHVIYAPVSYTHLTLPTMVWNVVMPMSTASACSA